MDLLQPAKNKRQAIAIASLREWLYNLLMRVVYSKLCFLMIRIKLNWNIKLSKMRMIRTVFHFIWLLIHKWWFILCNEVYALLELFNPFVLYHEISRFTSGSFPSDTKFLALHPSEPIHENIPVALFRRTARITSRTSWSEPKMIAPAWITNKKKYLVFKLRKSFQLKKGIIYSNLKEKTIIEFFLSYFKMS